MNEAYFTHTQKAEWKAGNYKSTFPPFLLCCLLMSLWSRKNNDFRIAPQNFWSEIGLSQLLLKVFLIDHFAFLLL